MLGEKHTLYNDFPQHQGTINQLKQQDPSFAHLCDKYDEIDKEVFDIEMGQSVSSDEHLEACKIRRVALKDELYQRLKEADRFN